MIFFPYRAQIKLHKWPVVTLAIALLCLGIYQLQERNGHAVTRYIDGYCDTLVLRAKSAPASAWFGEWTECREILRSVHMWGAAPGKYATTVAAARGAEAVAAFQRDQAALSRRAPSYLTAKLWHDRGRFDLPGMISSSFAHGDWGHVIGNLIFFFAFAATVELIIGPVLFIGVVLLMSLGIGLIDSAVHIGQQGVLPSLGLSGVVTGMLALFMYFIPRAKIDFFFWFLFSIGSIGIPAWLVGAWYIGWDAYYNLSDTFSYTNYTAHLAGAAMGLLLGVSAFRNKRAWARGLIFDRADLTQSQGFFHKLNAFTAAPGILAAASFVYLLVIVLIVAFVTSFWVQLLMLLPPAAGLWHLYRQRKADRPQWRHYQDAVSQLKQGREGNAVAALEALVAQGSARAMYTLANLHSSGRGVIKDPQKAAQLMQQAATRGHAEALYQFGAMCIDGRGVAQDTARGVECYRQAAEKGMAQAAFGLGHLYETGQVDPKNGADERMAAEWYYKAGVLFLREKSIDDARSALISLQGLQADHPLTAKLDQQVSEAEHADSAVPSAPE